jgi:hypothetical protein
MRIERRVLFTLLFCTGILPIASHAATPCPAGVDPTASAALTQQSAPQHCSAKMSRAYPIPDPRCTPGAINPTVTLAVLQGGKFKTGCERNRASSVAAKNKTYDEYDVPHPAHNRGRNQVCELDHLVSLELGGADTVDNIWPQCGPDHEMLAKRYFKIKDGVENYLAVQVRDGHIDLQTAQRGIAKDWTSYISKSETYWKSHDARGFGLDE